MPLVPEAAWLLACGKRAEDHTMPHQLAASNLQDEGMFFKLETIAAQLALTESSASGSTEGPGFPS